MHFATMCKSMRYGLPNCWHIITRVLLEGQVGNCSSSANGQSENEVSTSFGNQPNQTKSFTFPKRTLELKKPICCSFQSYRFKKWPWLHYNQVNNKAFVSCNPRLQRQEFYRVVHIAGQPMPPWIVAIPTGKSPAETRKVGFLCTSGHTFTGIVQVYSLDLIVMLPRWYLLSRKNKKQSIVHTLEKSCRM